MWRLDRLHHFSRWPLRDRKGLIYSFCNNWRKDLRIPVILYSITDFCEKTRNNVWNVSESVVLFVLSERRSTAFFASAVFFLQITNTRRCLCLALPWCLLVLLFQAFLYTHLTCTSTSPVSGVVSNPDRSMADADGLRVEMEGVDGSSWDNEEPLPYSLKSMIIICLHINIAEFLF